MDEQDAEDASLTDHVTPASSFRSDGVVDTRFRRTRPMYCVGCTPERVMMLPMTLLLAAIILLTYYPFVILQSHETPYQKFEVALFHISLFLMLASYFQCMCLDPGSVPELWAEEHAEDETLQRCRKCNLPKPPRAHYCSVTKRLVLNMDHFCPWIVNTVGFYNRKFFVLFLLWTCVTILVFIGSSIVDLTTAKADADDNTADQIPSIFNLFLALLIDASLLLFLGGFLGFHVYLVVKNRTTIEIDTLKFDVGVRANIEQVFGRNPWIWFLPIYGEGPNGDGIHWPMQEDDGADGAGPGRGPPDSELVDAHAGDRVESMVELEMGAVVDETNNLLESDNRDEHLEKGHSSMV